MNIELNKIIDLCDIDGINSKAQIKEIAKNLLNQIEPITKIKGSQKPKSIIGELFMTLLVDSKRFEDVRNNPDKRENHGKYLMISGGKYTALDNTQEVVLVEAFDSLTKAADWLNRDRSFDKEPYQKHL